MIGPTGADWSNRLPFPIVPASPRPQQYVKPLAVRPHVCESPTARLVNVRPPVTGTGTVPHASPPQLFGPAAVPTPNWPSPLPPQQ